MRGRGEQPTHQEAALCQWFTRGGGGAWNHSSLPSSPNTSHNSRDELSSQKPLLLLIKALYIFVIFFLLPVFIHSFDKRSMLLLYFFSTGVHHHFHASIIPRVVVFVPFFMFLPQTFCVEQKSSYFCIFISCGKADCRLFVSPLKGSALSSWVCSLLLHQVMNRWAVMDVRGLSFQFLMTKKWKGKKIEELFSRFLSPLVSFRSFVFFFSFKLFV